MSTLRSKLFETCPKTGRIVGVRKPQGLMRLAFPLVGLLALVWFLVRVLPRPSRAAYPCQQVAMPLASGFVLWLTGIAASTLAFRKARVQFRQARYVTGIAALAVALLGVGWTVASQNGISQAGVLPERVEYVPHPANQPIGVAKGYKPGRVVWVHDPQVTDWNGAATVVGESWFNHINQTEATDMMQSALKGYADTATPSAAWNAIFQNFNGGAAYQPGEKVFIKVNLTTSNSDACADANYNWGLPPRSGCGGVTWASIGNSPQLLRALLDQLVNEVGVAQSDITIGDSTGLWVNELYNMLQPTFPNVRYMDARGTLGRTKATRSTVPLYWSTTEANGKSQDYLLQAVADAKYLINFSILKAHERNGITVAAKNHFGSLSGGNDNPRKPTTTNYYNIHLRLPLETDANSWPQRASMAQYRPLVDLNGHQGMGGKTVLYLVDGIYAGKGWAGVPSTWSMTPFGGDWPSSLFVSMDEVAVDSVAFDFLSQQWADLALAAEGVQDYMHEMALANNPPSGTFYDPEHDGQAMASQGVHEHWNNPVDKQYTRNLSPSGTGIELVKVEKSRACGQQTVLFVGSTNPLIDRDQILVNRLNTAGYSSVVLSQSQARTIDANGKDLVIISDSVDSTTVGTKFRSVTVPVINWEPALFDDLGMTGTGASDFGSEAGQTQVNIVDPNHPLAAGLSGLLTTTNAAWPYTWGAPSANASVVATVAANPARKVLFGYETGTTMVGMNAPARRVGFFNGYGDDFTPEGGALFDASVKWALECGSVSGGFSLINGDTGAFISALNNGDTLDLSTLPPNLVFRASTDPSVTGSVAFAYDGGTTVDNTPPYEFAGPLLEWVPVVGSHVFTAQPFSRADGVGTAGEPLTVQFTATVPLAITLASFDAAAAGDHVLVEWETVTERDNTGFNLYRSTSPAAPAELLAFVPSQAPGSTQGASYTYQDSAVTPGDTYWYWLEDVSTSGATTRHGPVSATVQTPTAVALTEFSANGGTGGAWLWMVTAAAGIAALTALAVVASRRWRFM